MKYKNLFEYKFNLKDKKNKIWMTRMRQKN